MSRPGSAVELAQLEAFVQVAHHRSFSRAADALFLTQPSVTARIQALERELGEKLFERTGRSVVLTDAGLALLPYAQRALTSVQEGAEAIEAVRHGEVGSIRIGASASLSTYLLPRVLQRFHQIRPRVHIRVRTGTSEDVIEHLLASEVHLAICRLTAHPDIEATHLFNDDLCLVVPTGHGFAQRHSVPLLEASREPFIFFERGSAYHNVIYSMFLRAGVVPESTMELDSIETTKHMVVAGLGIAILPLISVAHELNEGGLARVEMEGLEQPAQREVGLHVPRHRAHGPPLRDLLKVIADEFPGRPPVQRRAPARA